MASTCFSSISPSVSPERSIGINPDSGMPRKPLKPKEEINFILLLQKTEEHFSNFASLGKIPSPKFVFFVKQLVKMVGDLEIHAQKPDKDIMVEYKSRVEFLQKLVDDLTPSDDMDPNFGFDLPSLGLEESTPLLISNWRSKNDSSNSDTGYLLSILPELKTAKKPLPKALGNNVKTAREIQQKRTQHQILTKRKQLLGQDDQELRRRNVKYGTEESKDDDLDSLMKAHYDAQEQVAEEMILLTKSLKEQSLAAGEIIRKDTKTLQKSSDLADKNTEKLGIESDRLSEHTNRLCRCWIWFVIVIVTFTFIAMVLLMKLFKKRNI